MTSAGPSLVTLETDVSIPGIQHVLPNTEAIVSPDSPNLIPLGFLIMMHKFSLRWNFRDGFVFRDSSGRRVQTHLDIQFLPRLGEPSDEQALSALHSDFSRVLRQAADDVVGVTAKVMDDAATEFCSIFVGDEESALAGSRHNNPLAKSDDNSPPVIPPEHFLSHIPKIPGCPGCDLAKQAKARAYRVQQHVVAPEVSSGVDPKEEKEEHEAGEPEHSGVKVEEEPGIIHVKDEIIEDVTQEIQDGTVVKEETIDKIEKESLGNPDFLKQVHIDLIGPTTESVEGHTGAAIMRDRATTYPWAGTLADKSPLSVLDFWREHFPGFTNGGRAPLSCYSDNGGEFRAEFERWLIDHGTKPMRSVPLDPRTNAWEERYHFTVEQAVRASMSTAGGPIRFWSFCLRHVIHNLARTPNSSGVVPYTERTGLPVTSVLVPWGCRAIFKVMDAEKFASSGAEGVVLEYGPVRSFKVMDLKHYVDTKGEVRTHVTRGDLS
jgi:hypothetical protein